VAGPSPGYRERMTEEQQPFPAEGPDEPGYTGEDDRPILPEPPGEFPDDPDYAGEEERPVPEPEEEYDGGGQVSEVQNLDPALADTPISPEDSVAGAPAGSGAGRPDTQGSGPDAAPPENRRDNDMQPAGHHLLGEGIEDE